MKRKVRMYKPQFQQGGPSNEEFEVHMMYNPETGEGVEAKTVEEHLQLKEMGYLHKDEMQQMEQSMLNSHDNFPFTEMQQTKQPMLNSHDNIQ